MQSTLSNYRALIAEEIIRKNSHCNRCTERNRKYEENTLENSVEFCLDKNRAKKKRVKLPNLMPRVILNDTQRSINSNFNNYQSQSHFQQNPFSNNSNNQFSSRHFTDSSDSFVKRLSTFNTMLSVSTGNFNMGNRKPIINKFPIEIERRNLF